jgi:HAD superfamily hydrolase (TIGR01509 family)
MSAHHAAWAHFLARQNIRLPREELHRRMHGKTNREILLDIVDSTLSDADIERMAVEKERVYREEFYALVRPMPGLNQFLARTRAAGVPVAVATSATAANIEFVFALLGLGQAFPIVVGAEQIRHGKPDPEVFLVAAQRLGVAPAHCLAFEDSLPGIEAARRAGMSVVALTTGYSRQELAALDGVVDVIDHYDDIDPQQLLDYIEPVRSALA